MGLVAEVDDHAVEGNGLGSIASNADQGYPSLAPGLARVLRARVQYCGKAHGVQSKLQRNLAVFAVVHNIASAYSLLRRCLLY